MRACADWGFPRHLHGQGRLVYLAVPNSNSVVVLDRNLNYARSLTGTNTPFGTICGIVCDSQTNLYVVEPSRIKRFDAQGNSVLAWGSVGSLDGQFTARTNLAYGEQLPNTLPSRWTRRIRST